MNIYVGNLAFEVTQGNLEELFNQYGTVNSAVVMIDKITRKPRGFGFVEMPNDEEAQAAMNELNGQEYFGRELKVNEARPRTENAPSTQRTFNRRPGGFNQGGGGFNNNRGGGGGFNKGGGGYQNKNRNSNYNSGGSNFNKNRSWNSNEDEY